jgi:hypothetical protein
MKNEEWVVSKRKERSLIKFFLADLVSFYVFRNSLEEVGGFYQAKSLVNIFFVEKVIHIENG